MLILALRDQILILVLRSVSAWYTNLFTFCNVNIETWLLQEIFQDIEKIKWLSVHYFIQRSNWLSVKYLKFLIKRITRKLTVFY